MILLREDLWLVRPQKSHHPEGQSLPAARYSIIFPHDICFVTFLCVMSFKANSPDCLTFKPQTCLMHWVEVLTLAPAPFYKNTAISFQSCTVHICDCFNLPYFVYCHGIGLCNLRLGWGGVGGGYALMIVFLGICTRMNQSQIHKLNSYFACHIVIRTLRQQALKCAIFNIEHALYKRSAVCVCVLILWTCFTRQNEVLTDCKTWLV